MTICTVTCGARRSSITITCRPFGNSAVCGFGSDTRNTVFDTGALPFSLMVLSAGCGAWPAISAVAATSATAIAGTTN
jgi:hypothetical protein